MFGNVHGICSLRSSQSRTQSEVQSRKKQREDLKILEKNMKVEAKIPQIFVTKSCFIVFCQSSCSNLTVGILWDSFFCVLGFVGVYVFTHTVSK